MKRRHLAGVTLAALALAQVPLVAQETPPGVLKPFNEDGSPVPRAQPVERPIPKATLVKPAATPVPRPVPQAPAPESAPEATPGTVAPPKPMKIPEPGDDGTITIAPNAKPTSPDEVQLNIADNYFAKKQYDMAAPEYERYLGLYQTAPNRATAYFRLGESYRLRGTVNAARTAYETLLSQYSTGDFIGPAAYRLADLYYQDKQFREALNMYRKASVRLKEPAVANAAKFFTGRCLEALGQKLEARATYEDLVATPKDNLFLDASRLSLALLLKDSSRTSEAIKQITILAKDTENPDLKLEATVRLGLWQLEASPPQPPLAESAFKAALELPGKPYWKELAQLGQMRLWATASKAQPILDLYTKPTVPFTADTKPEVLLLVAGSYRQLGKLPEALSTYDQVTKEFPGSVYDKEAQFERLRSMYATDDPKLVEEIDKYLLANPEASKRDEVLLMKGEVLFKKEDYAGAMQIYSTLELSHQLTGIRKADALFRLGWCQMQTQNIEQAVKTFSSFINGYPTHKMQPLALLQRGLAQQMLKNLAGALKDYDTLLKNFPKVPQREKALQQQGLIQGQQGNNSAMAESFKTLLKEFPESAAKAQANYWVGWAAYELKNYKEAIAPLDTARKLDKETWGEKAGIRLLLAQYYLESPTETAREVEAYSKEGKTKVPPEILRWLGKTFHDGGSQESAEKYLLLLAAREEVTPDDYLLLAECEYSLGKFQPSVTALQTYLKSVKYPVPRANGLLTLARSQVGLKALDAAQKSVDEALSLQPEGEVSGRAKIAAGDIQIARGNFEEAAKLYESVAIILDDAEITPQALEKAIDAWKSAGRSDDAAKTLNKLKSRYPEYRSRNAGNP